MPDYKSQIHLDVAEDLTQPLMGAGTCIPAGLDTGAGLLVDLEMGRVGTRAIAAPYGIELAMMGTGEPSAVPTPAATNTDFLQLPEKVLRKSLLPLLGFRECLAVRAISEAGKFEISHMAIEADKIYSTFEDQLNMPRAVACLQKAFGARGVFRVSRGLGARGVLATFNAEDLRQTPKVVLTAMLKELTRSEAGLLAHQNLVLFKKIYTDLERIALEDRRKIERMDFKSRLLGACAMTAALTLGLIGIILAAKEGGGAVPITMIVIGGLIAVGSIWKKCSYMLGIDRLYAQREREDQEFQRELQALAEQAALIPLEGSARALPSVASYTVQLIPWADVHREAVARGQVPPEDDAPSFSGRLE